MEEPEVIEPGETTSVTVIESQTRGEMATLIDLAQRYPRRAGQAKVDAIDLATMDEDTAMGCFYNIPRGGKEIEGPSARLAEIVAGTWGNCKCGARIIDTTPTHVVAQGVFVDLQKNLSYSVEVKRKITDKQGRRFSEDMITVTSNAACSIALRNAVFKGVPQGVWKPAWDAAKKAAIGDAKTLVSRRTGALNHFAKMGKQEDAVLALLGVERVDEVTGEMVLKLLGWATAIRDGDTTVDEVFKKVDGPRGTEQADAVNAKLKQQEAKPKPREKKPKKAPETPVQGPQEVEKPVEDPEPDPPVEDPDVPPGGPDAAVITPDELGEECHEMYLKVIKLRGAKPKGFLSIIDEMGYNDDPEDGDSYWLLMGFAEFEALFHALQAG